MTKQISVGGVRIGGGAPVTIQSMTKTRTSDVPSTVGQINELAELGCDIVRVAVPDIASANAIGEIKERISVPLVADVHFDHKLALRAAEAGADKIRINPGNIGGVDNVRAVANICSKKSIPIRIGVNSGSLSKDVLARHGGLTAEALYESALEHIALLNRFDFDDICLSAKSSSVRMTVETYRLLHQRTNYPLHLGVTEAGTEHAGLVKSSIGIGALLLGGIGDTIRVSLTAAPEREVEAAQTILISLGLRSGYDLISCPTCGRCRIDLIPIANEVDKRLRDKGTVHLSYCFARQTNDMCSCLMQTDEPSFKTDEPSPCPAGTDEPSPCPAAACLTVAVMGCAVNGPGEASRADYGIAGGDGAGVIFKKGEIIKKVPMDKLVDELFLCIESGD